MKRHKLKGKRVAILATDGFEQTELMETKKELEDVGAEVKVISLKPGFIKGWYHNNWGEGVAVDEMVTDANPQTFDALMLPGGAMNPDILRMNPAAVRFAAHFVERGKTIGAICHGPSLLIETNALKGRTLTSWPSIKTDLKNAGANWLDEAVVVDNGLVTSRKPEDIPAFSEKLIQEILADRHQTFEASVGF